MSWFWTSLHRAEAKLQVGSFHLNIKSSLIARGGIRAAWYLGGRDPRVPGGQQTEGHGQPSMMPDRALDQTAVTVQWYCDRGTWWGCGKEGKHKWSGEGGTVSRRAGISLDRAILTMGLCFLVWWKTCSFYAVTEQIEHWHASYILHNWFYDVFYFGQLKMFPSMDVEVEEVD
jgi:hypothetical protein